MKKLQSIKKFAVMVLSAMMVLTSLALPTFAAENKTATIKGVDSDATVVAYQFVEQNATTYKWQPKAWVGATELADKSGFEFTHGDTKYTYYYESTDYGSGTKDNKPALEALANKARTNPPTTQQAQKVTFTAGAATDGKADFTGTLNTLGSYIVIVDSNNTNVDSVTVYSPMVVSMAYAMDDMGTPDDDSDDQYTMQAGTILSVTAKSPPSSGLRR